MQAFSRLVTLLKRDSNAGVFLRILQQFWLRKHILINIYKPLLLKYDLGSYYFEGFLKVFSINLWFYVLRHLNNLIQKMFVMVLAMTAMIRSVKINWSFPFYSWFHFKGCVRYIIASLILKSKQEHLWN